MTSRAILFVMMTVLAITLGCSDDKITAIDTEELEIHLWQTFSEDFVRVQLDSQVIFQGVISTNSLLSLARLIPTETQQGEHRVTVIVNDTHIGTTDFDLKRPLFIGVSFQRTPPEFVFHFMSERPWYD